MILILKYAATEEQGASLWGYGFDPNKYTQDEALKSGTVTEPTE